MTYVERPHLSFVVWGEPLRGSELNVVRVGDALQISGLFPTYRQQGGPSDLLSQYETARKKRPIGKMGNGKDSPHVVFANSDTDEKLIAFVRTFGPVVAESVYLSDHQDGKSMLLTAKQDLSELGRERSVYRAALELVVELARASSTPQDTYDDELGKNLIREIAAHIRHWPGQWEREREGRNCEPLWRPSAGSLQRVQQLGSSTKDMILPPNIDARIVLCELLNIFPSVVFPNPLEAYSSIRYGVRPLLYSILRRELLHPHETAVCENNRCRDFFEVERTAQQFCTPECSRQHRQREYWMKAGKDLRAKRLKQRRPRSR